MIDIITELESKIGTSVEGIILIVTVLGAMLFCAKELRLGLVIATLLFAAEFVVFYQVGWEYMYAFAAFLASLVVLIISLFISYQRTRSMV